jgi:shikimate kinase
MRWPGEGTPDEAAERLDDGAAGGPEELIAERELAGDGLERVPITRIILIGFMAAGKSTVGPILARRLGWEFVDFDEEIERRTGLTIPEIFQRHGAPWFRELERSLTEEVATLSEVVLSPGGGWVTQPDLLEYFGPETLVVWLRISPEAAVARALRTITHRPLLADAPDPIERARSLMQEREPLYRLADLTVDVEGREAEDLAAEIISRAG